MAVPIFGNLTGILVVEVRFENPRVRNGRIEETLTGRRNAAISDGLEQQTSNYRHLLSQRPQADICAARKLMMFQNVMDI